MKNRLKYGIVLILAILSGCCGGGASTLRATFMVQLSAAKINCRHFANVYASQVTDYYVRLRRYGQSEAVSTVTV